MSQVRSKKGRDFEEIKKELEKLEKRLKRLEIKISDDFGHRALCFFNLDLKPVSYLRVKKVEVKNKKMVRVTLESPEGQFTFAGDILEVLPNMEKILHHWKKNVIPRRIALEKLTKEEIKKMIERVEGMEV